MVNGMKYRLVLIAFFIGINLILGSYFLLTVKGQSIVPNSLREFFLQHGLVSNETFSTSTDTTPDYSLRVDLDPDSVIAAINQQRDTHQVKKVIPSTKLHQVAEDVLAELKQKNFELSQEDGNALLEESLKKGNYFYSSAYQSIVVGPVSSSAVVEYWFNNKQEKTILEESVTDIGVATMVEPINGEFTGVTVVILAQPRGVTAVFPTPTPQPAKPALPQISDEEVIEALNRYRTDHTVSTLQVNDHLCAYAEKRVGDLVAYGGLDNHQGFKKDFEDPNNPPAALKDYPAGKIAENLAHQFCRNMTTGDSFVAQTGTAIIEWCFDSSTKGHRETQLSSDYHNVCVRHADGMYVVIFSE